LKQYVDVRSGFLSLLPPATGMTTLAASVTPA
jgi:hypothetical protein